MRTSVENILRAEQDAKGLLDDANERARAIAEASKARRTQILEAATQRAQAEATALRERTLAQAQSDSATIAEAARARAEAITDRARSLDLASLEQLIQHIAGLGA